MLKNFILFLVAIVLYLFGGELALRAWFSDITTTYDNRSYFALKWKAANIRTNSAGYREREFDRPKPPGVYRIAFLGDSFTFGQGIREEERLSNLLERELKKRMGGIEVLNFGNPGHNTADEVKVLKTDVMPEVAPDFVLLQWYVNDMEFRPSPPAVEGGGAGTGKTSGDLVNEFKQKMLNVSVIYFLLADVVHRVRDMLVVSHADETYARVGDPESPESREAERAMIEFIRTARAGNVPVGIVLVPHLSPLKDGEYPFLYLHKRVLGVCEREGVTCVDLFPLMEPYLKDETKYMQLWVNRFDSHMGPFANELAAQRVMEVFGPSWAAATGSNRVQ